MAKKTVLITGCSAGGMGAAIAQEFHKRGHTVIATARSAAKMSELAELGIGTLELDVTSEESIQAAAAKLSALPSIAAHGLDMLINNAGVSQIMPFADCSLGDLRRVLDTNLFGTLAVTHTLLPLLVRAGGLVVLMNSLVPWLGGVPYQTTYTASKMALIGAANSLRVELGPLGLRVVSVFPGAVSTRLFSNQDPAKGLPEGSWYAPLRERIEGRDFLAHTKWMSPEVFAEQVATQLLKPKPALEIWKGDLTTIVRWMKWLFMWPGIMDYIYRRGVGLNTLKPPVIRAGPASAASAAEDSSAYAGADIAKTAKGAKDDEN